MPRVVSAYVYPRRNRSIDPSATDALRGLASHQALFEQLEQHPHDEALWRRIEVAYGDPPHEPGPRPAVSVVTAPCAFALTVA